MKAIWIIAGRELRSFFDSLMAYILLALFLGFSGFFTWLYGNDIFITGQASLRVFFMIAFWTLFFFIPAITMKMFSDEKRSGTLELLLTKPVTDSQVVLGKFLAALTLVSLALLFTLPYLVTVMTIGNPDLGQALCGYLGLLLISAAYIGIGLFMSSLTGNQLLAFLLSLSTGLFFQVIAGILAKNSVGITGRIFQYLSFPEHFESIARGVIDTRDLLFFLSLSALGIILTRLILTRRNVN